MDPTTIILIIILSFLLITALIFAVWGLCEAHTLEINESTLGKPSEGKDRVRLFFFSDLHAEFCFIKAERLCQIIKEAHAKEALDAIVFGGDIVSRRFFIKRGQRYLKAVRKTADELGIPFYGITGNHDRKLTEAEDNDSGFDLIEDRYILLKPRIALSGVNDSGRDERVWFPVPDVPEGITNILIAHNPDQILNLSGGHTDYMLSGHIHGGQIRTPIGIEFSLLRKDLLPKMGMIQGKYEHEGISFYISRGIGCVLLPFRIKAKPEVTVITVYGK